MKAVILILQHVSCHTLLLGCCTSLFLLSSQSPMPLFLSQRRNLAHFKLTLVLQPPELDHFPHPVVL